MDQISEKDLMTDLMQTQRFITSSYNGKASESTSWALKEQMLRVLEDEQLNLSLINQAMEQRGWSQSPPAKQQDIQEALIKFNDPQLITDMEQLLQPQYQITKEATTMYGQNFPTQSLNDFRQSNGSYGSNQLGYAGGGISGAQGFGNMGQSYGGTGFGTQTGFGQPTGLSQQAGFGQPTGLGQQAGYQTMGTTAGFQGPAYQGYGFGNQLGAGYQGTGWGQQMGMGGIMNTAAQNLQSNFPSHFSGVMGNWTQTRPDVYGIQGGYANQPFGGQYQQTGFQGQQPNYAFQGQQPYYGFQGQPQYLTQNQFPQTSYQGQNVLNNFQQTRGDYGMGNRGYTGGGQGFAGGYGVGGSYGGQGFGGTTMGTTIGTGFGGNIMNSAANTLQSNLGNLRGNVLNDWSLTSPENQNEFLSQQRQFGNFQAGAIPAGLQAQMMQTQPYNQQNAGYANTTGLGASNFTAQSPWSGSALAGTALGTAGFGGGSYQS